MYKGLELPPLIKGKLSAPIDKLPRCSIFLEGN